MCHGDSQPQAAERWTLAGARDGQSSGNSRTIGQAKMFKKQYSPPIRYIEDANTGEIPPAAPWPELLR